MRKYIFSLYIGLKKLGNFQKLISEQTCFISALFRHLFYDLKIFLIRSYSSPLSYHEMNPMCKIDSSVSLHFLGIIMWNYHRNF